jgi:mannose-6-phosphate isomerase-like protein (cupin superfamily)
MRAPPPFPVSAVPWHEPPGHQASFSQYLVGLEEHGAGVEVRMSRCTPGGSVASHVHERAEHVYVFLSGSGEATSDDVAYVVEGDMCLYIPPAIEHSIRTTGPDDLVFLVITSPSGAIPR